MNLNEDAMRNLLVSILSNYDPSLSTIQASNVLDGIVTETEKVLGISYKELQETPY